MRLTNTEIKKLCLKAEKYSAMLSKVLGEVRKVIVGQDQILEKLVIALIADGHVLLEGVPGLAKTLMIKTLAQTLNVSFCRIQFTPDLLPADIIGTKIYDHQKSSFRTEKGPVFHNFILADEINRAPPKVQSALLEAMQERQVTIHGSTFKLEKPFFVMATENPIESEGTYKLPEAQVDRFAFKLLISYPSLQQEKLIIQRNTQSLNIEVKPILNAKQIVEVQSFNQHIYADEKIVDYIARIVDATRFPENYGLKLDGIIEFGASPRASIWLMLASKAHALLQGRGFVMPEDVKAVAKEVLRHRLILTYEAEAENFTTDKVVSLILDKIKTP
ncbi:MoxR family ATPase [Candidatus Woesearchaeota archaeon]|nr:MoxR family ATPase [Candidatus Woesearchaeota archaeon]